MRCKSCQRKWKRELFEKTTHVPYGSEVTLRIFWAHKNSDVLRNPRETETKLQILDFDTIRPERLNLPRN